MKRLKAYYLAVIYTLFLLLSHTAYCVTLSELYTTDQLRLNVWIEPEDNIITGQQVNIQIEIATNKRFSAGTQIGRFEIDDAIVMQREKFAINSVRQEGTVNWTVQQWTLVVYPQRNGPFTVPAIPLTISIAADNLNSIVGKVSTQPFTFNTVTPEEVRHQSNWIATNRFEVEESFNKTPEELSPGDALIRTIKLSAENLPAMMLPKVTVDDIQGIAIYAKPPQLHDKVNRGDYFAERTEIITYVFERKGDYQLPKQIYFWWNLDSQSFEKIELEEHNLSIRGVSSKTLESDQQSNVSSNDQLFSLFIKAIITLLLLFGIWFSIKKYRINRKKIITIKSEQLSEAALRKQFNQACSSNDMETAISLLYQWLDYYAESNYEGSIQQTLQKLDQAELSMLFKNIMQSVYTDKTNDNIDLKLFANQLIDKLNTNKSKSISSLFRIELKLN